MIGKMTDDDAIVISYSKNREDSLPRLDELEALRQQVRDLEEEVAMKSAYATHLERSMGEITPLRRHIRRQLKQRVRGIDQRMIARLQSSRRYTPNEVVIASDADARLLFDAIQEGDEANVARYNQASKRTLGLISYLFVRRLAIGAVSRLLRLRKV